MKQHPHRHRPRQQGFSLLEVLVAFSIMALALGLLYQAMGSSVRHVGEGAQYQRAVVLAESILSLRDAVSEDGWNQSGVSAGLAWRVSSARYATAVRDPRAPALHEISVSIDWDEGGRRRQLELSTLRPQRTPPVGAVLR